MNMTQINAIRASMSLPPLTVDTTKQAAQKKRQAANKAAHAALQRDLKAKRNKGGK